MLMITRNVTICLSISIVLIGFLSCSKSKETRKILYLPSTEIQELIFEQPVRDIEDAANGDIVWTSGRMLFLRPANSSKSVLLVNKIDEPPLPVYVPKGQKEYTSILGFNGKTVLFTQSYEGKGGGWPYVVGLYYNNIGESQITMLKDAADPGGESLNEAMSNVAIVYVTLENCIKVFDPESENVQYKSSVYKGALSQITISGNNLVFLTRKMSSVGNRNPVPVLYNLSKKSGSMNLVLAKGQIIGVSVAKDVVVFAVQALNGTRKIGFTTITESGFQVKTQLLSLPKGSEVGFPETNGYVIYCGENRANYVFYLIASKNYMELPKKLGRLILGKQKIFFVNERSTHVKYVSMNAIERD